MKSSIFGRDENGQRWTGMPRITAGEMAVSTGLLMVVISVAVAVTTSTPLALLPGIIYAIAAGIAHRVYRQSMGGRHRSAAAAGKAKRNARPRLDAHPLLDSGWEDELADDALEWVDEPASVSFKIVGSRGICPKGYIHGDIIKVAANGPVVPGLCAAAEAVLRMAAADDSDVREWCCPVYDHLLVFKKLDKVS